MPDTYLLPDGTDLNESNAWTNESASSANPHLSIDESGTPDDDTTFAECNSSGGNRALRVTLSAMVDMVSATALTVEIRSRDNTGGGAHVTWVVFLYIGGAEYTLTPTSQVLTGSYVDYTFTTGVAGINPATGNPFTQAELNALILGIRQNVHATSIGRVTRARVKITYTPISGDISVVRRFASLFLRTFRRPIPMFRDPVPLVFLDLELGDDHSGVHPAGPHPQGLGWRFLPASERGGPFRVRETNLDLNTMKLEVLSDDRRDFLCMFWETFEAIRTSLAEDGNAQLHAGGTIMMARASDMWDVDPGSYLVARYGSGIKALVDHGTAADAKRGMVIEDARTNYLRRSSFVDGITGWTRTGGGAGAALAAETPATNPLFDPAVSNNCLRLTMGDASADHVLSSPDTPSVVSIAGIHRFSIDHQDDSGATFYYRARRVSDAFFYRDDTGVWQAGAFDNPMTVRTSRDRDVSKPIDFGASTTFNFTMRQLAGGSAGRVNRLYHVQLENGYGVTSRIVTGADVVARALATYKYGHTTTKPAVLVTNGTLQMKWVPLFSSGDNASGTVTIWEIVFDANNLMRLQYNAASGNMEFVMRQGGTSTTATKSVTLTRGTEIDIACRWTSTNGELGLTARTHSVFVNGVKGTDATRAGDPTNGTADMYIGGSSTVGANGKVRRFCTRALCMRDEEIARGTP